jgi:serine/threonine-protein kinase
VIGQRVKDFTLVERLGGGGMGEVFVGEHALVGTRAAVKVLRAELSADRAQVERFFNEARASSAIAHAGVVKVFDVGFMDDGRAYLVMELVKGESLAARLARRSTLPVADAAELGRQIAGVPLRVARASNGKQNPFVARRELFGDFAVAAAAK